MFLWRASPIAAGTTNTAIQTCSAIAKVAGYAHKLGSTEQQVKIASVEHASSRDDPTGPARMSTKAAKAIGTAMSSHAAPGIPAEEHTQQLPQQPGLVIKVELRRSADARG